MGTNSKYIPGATLESPLFLLPKPYSCDVNASLERLQLNLVPLERAGALIIVPKDDFSVLGDLVLGDRVRDCLRRKVEEDEGNLVAKSATIDKELRVGGFEVLEVAVYLIFNAEDVRSGVAEGQEWQNTRGSSRPCEVEVPSARSKGPSRGRSWHSRYSKSVKRRELVSMR
jgi:hypothetical protein